jgi:phosphatidylglycerophosphatase A
MANLVSKWCSRIVSCGIPPHVPLGTIIGSLVALPLVALWRIAYDYTPTPMMWFALGAFIIAALASFVASRVPAEEAPLFVIDKVAGLVFVFMGISLTLKLMVIGVVLFHALRVLIPLNKYDHYVQMVRFIGTENNIFYSVLSGLAINILLHFALWIAH